MNPELEKLLEYALVDGHLSDKDRRVLFKKAEKLGFDQEELEIILEARLNSNLKEHENKIRKCISCGEVLKSLNATCPACDYINDDEDLFYEDAVSDLDDLEMDIYQFSKFVNISANVSYKDLLENIEKNIVKLEKKYSSEPKLKERLDELSAEAHQVKRKYKKSKAINRITWLIILFAFGWLIYYISGNTATSPVKITEELIKQNNIGKAKIEAEKIEEKSSRDFYLFEIQLLEADSLIAVKKYDEGLAIINLIKDGYERREKINEVITTQVNDLIQQKKYDEALERISLANGTTQYSLQDKIEFAKKTNTKK